MPRNSPRFQMCRKIVMCIVALNLSVIAWPAWSECNQPDRAPISRYVINGGEVYDTQTHLTWKRCSVGQVWTEGRGCVGTIRTLTFEQAKQQVDTNWRLPTGKELVTLIRFCQHPAINEEAFPNMSMPIASHYWADTNDENQFPTIAEFYYGGTTAISRTQTAAVRLIHR